MGSARRALTAEFGTVSLTDLPSLAAGGRNVVLRADAESGIESLA